MANPTLPAPRTIRIDLPAPFEGYYVVAKVDFPARVLTDLQSGDFERAIGAFQRITLDHNLPDDTGNKAADFMDVDPFDMVRLALEAWGEGLGKLPPR